jgi:hypothetical protein
LAFATGNDDAPSTALDLQRACREIQLLKNLRIRISAAHGGVFLVQDGHKTGARYVTQAITLTCRSIANQTGV